MGRSIYFALSLVLVLYCVFAISATSGEVAVRNARKVNLLCNEPKATGPCRGSMKRYYFDRSAGRCKQFTFGGCQGNGNNFESFRECYSACRYNKGRK